MSQQFSLKWTQLRETYPVFHYDSFQYSWKEDHIEIQFQFRTEELVYRPTMMIKYGNWLAPGLKNSLLDSLVFNIGMIELISYWKATASPVVHIHPAQLSVPEQNWWKKLYFKGLSEYFYQNGIETSQEEFFSFSFDAAAPHSAQFDYSYVPSSSFVIVPIGGGKDSVVTLEQLRSSRKIIPLIINPRGATLDCARVAGFDTLEQIFIIEREIDPLLLKVNAKGYLNGHTPFSAMLAFYTVLAAHLTQTRDIALSNESSANEATIVGTEINHQYSKSLEFERDFQYYVAHFMNDCAHYYSHLRPYSELQIAQFFAQYEQYHAVFRSCNAGSKENKWCCNCSKCLFAYIILSPFIGDDKMIQIFGEDLLDKESLVHYFDQLVGWEDTKPFECVGTVEEVNQAIQMILDSRKDKKLIQRYIQNNNLN